jgi:hypothetical protein
LRIEWQPARTVRSGRLGSFTSDIDTDGDSDEFVNCELRDSLLEPSMIAAWPVDAQFTIHHSQFRSLRHYNP